MRRRLAATLVLCALLAVGVPALARASGVWPRIGSVTAQAGQSSCSVDDGPSAQVQIDTRPRVTLEVARTPQERETGLMNRERLDPDSGMLFVFETPTTAGFWMRNTLIPLSVAWIDAAGNIVDIQDMQPLDETTHFPVASYLYALEVNQGWFVNHGVGTGQVVQFCLGA